MAKTGRSFCLALALAAAALSGCETARPIQLADGTHGWAIRCPDPERHIGGCIHEAAMICSGQFQIFGSDGDVIENTDLGAGNGLSFVDRVRRTMVVGCQHP